MTTVGPRTVTELVGALEPHQALCAFNVENFDTLKPAVVAAAQTGCPVVISFTVPAAQYLGYALTAELVAALARAYNIRYALHLDHCEYPDELLAAVAAGFSSGNFLDEGQIEPGQYLPAARRLRAEVGDRASLEFILGQLGHISDGHGHDHSHHMPTGETTTSDTSAHVALASVLEFATSCRPDIIGFDCGSLHGMRGRTRGLDLDLIRGVAQGTGLPIVLHGSSGVREEAVRAGIDAGVRKVNIETALRAVYVDTARSFLSAGGKNVGKPRCLTEATDAALVATYTRLLQSYTLREG